MHLVSYLLQDQGERVIDEFLKVKANLTSSTKNNYRCLLHQYLTNCDENGINFLSSSELDISRFLFDFEYKSTKLTYKTILNLFFKWCLQHSRLLNHFV